MFVNGLEDDKKKLSEDCWGWGYFIGLYKSFCFINC